MLKIIKNTNSSFVDFLLDSDIEIRQNNEKKECVFDNILGTVLMGFLGVKNGLKNYFIFSVFLDLDGVAHCDTISH